MPVVNLIQEQRAAVVKQERKLRLFFSAFLGTGAIAGLSFGLIFLKTELVQSETAGLNQKMTKIQPLLQSISENENQLSVMSPRLTSLIGAQAQTRRWSRLLRYLSTNTPREVWLTNIKCSQPNPFTPVSITFQGVSLTQAPVGQFLLRLKATSDLTDPKLKFTQADAAQRDEDAIKFELLADITGTAQPKPVTKSKKKEEGKSA